MATRRSGRRRSGTSKKQRPRGLCRTKWTAMRCAWGSLTRSTRYSIRRTLIVSNDAGTRFLLRCEKRPRPAVRDVEVGRPAPWRGAEENRRHLAVGAPDVDAPLVIRRRITRIVDVGNDHVADPVDNKFRVEKTPGFPR